MTWASRHGWPGGAPSLIQPNTSASSAYTPNLTSPAGRARGTSAWRRGWPGSGSARRRAPSPPAGSAAGGSARCPRTRRSPRRTRPGPTRRCDRTGVPEVVGQARGVDQVGIAPEHGPELAPDLRAFQGVGQPGPREIARADLDHLRLGRQPAQRRAVQHPGAVPLERAAPGVASPLGRLSYPPGRRVSVVAAPARHRLSLPPAVSATAARPASSRATGTRNGEQET